VETNKQKIQQQQAAARGSDNKEKKKERKASRTEVGRYRYRYEYSYSYRTAQKKGEQQMVIARRLVVLVGKRYRRRWCRKQKHKKSQKREGR